MSDVDADDAAGHAQTIEARDMTANGDIVFGGIQQYFSLIERANTREFSATTDGLAFTGQQEQELTDLFVGDAPTIDRLVQEVERSRVLLLAGERGMGKATTGLFIGAQIAMRQHLELPLLLVKPLDQNVRVDLRSAVAEKHFRSRVVLFADVFEYRNRSFLTSFARFEKLEWEQLTQALRDCDGYLIFTACRSDVSPFRSRVAGHIVQHELAPLDRDVVGQGFDRKLAHVVIKRPDRSGRCDILAQRRREVIAALETMSRVATFVDSFVGTDDELESAIRKFKNVDEWFLGNVQQDFDAWCTSLTLTLAQPTADANSIPWVDFELLRRLVAKRIKADDELFPPDGGSGRDASSDWSGQSFDDKPLLESSRAIITKDPERLGDVVCFSDGTYANELWKTLFAHHRRILTHLVPALLTMIEHERANARTSLRILAAQMIGRIGEIDPFRLSLPLIRRWASSNDRNQRPLVGRLVQGALASANQVYRQAALREIALLADRDMAESEEAARDRLVTAISAYAQIGVSEPAIAMQALGYIAVEILSPAVARIHMVWVKAETAEQHTVSAPPRVAQGLHRKHARLARVVNELTKEQAAALIALEMAIVQLSLLGDPIAVLNAMRDWIAMGGVQTGILIAVLFLQDIAADLHAFTVTTPETNSRSVVSPLLISLGSSRDAARTFAAFLVDLRVNITTKSSTYELPVALQNELEESFSSLLVTWARDSADTTLRDAVIELFAALASARGEMLRKELYELLCSPPFSESDAMKKFAVDARKALK